MISLIYGIILFMLGLGVIVLVIGVYEIYQRSALRWRIHDWFEMKRMKTEWNDTKDFVKKLPHKDDTK